MFDSNHNWQKEGFAVEGKGAKSDIMVASHPSAPGYLFKKYSKKISPKDQLKNYQRRIEGAAKLKEFIATHQIAHVVVPQKFLYELPAAFSRKGAASYVLVVERLMLLPSRDAKPLFQTLSEPALRQLCAILLAFRGLDSGVRNVSFTTDGQIAFVDTERWDERRKKKRWLHRIREYLTEDQRRIADAIRNQ